jgi:hypothetical protein
MIHLPSPLAGQRPALLSPASSLGLGPLTMIGIPGPAIPTVPVMIDAPLHVKFIIKPTMQQAAVCFIKERNL